jgi:hypothetical protein
LEALQREQQLEEEYSLKKDELSRLSENIVFKGIRLHINQLEQYFKQFGGPISQRRVFKLLDTINFISKYEITQFFKREQKQFFYKTELELPSGAKTIVRDGVELYSFSDTLKENEDLVNSFKILSHLRANKTLKDIKKQKDSWKQNGSTDIIIFESIIDDYSRISEELFDFLNNEITEKNIPVKLVTLFITSNAKAELIKATAAVENFRLIHFKEIDDAAIKPFTEATRVFETSEELSYAFAEVRKHFIQVRNDTLNVVFESHCPARSLPIFWCRTPNFSPLFYNEFGELESSSSDGEDLRTRLYLVNTEFSQKINRYIVDFLKQKAQEKGLDRWLSVELIPKKVVESVLTKHTADDQRNNEETYFDFLDYKKIIEKHAELINVFKTKGEQLAWLDRLNELRRDPAHPEKPAPRISDVEYYEKIKHTIFRQMNEGVNQNSPNSTVGNA